MGAVASAIAGFITLARFPGARLNRQLALARGRAPAPGIRSAGASYRRNVQRCRTIRLRWSVWPRLLFAANSGKGFSDIRLDAWCVTERTVEDGFHTVSFAACVLVFIRSMPKRMPFHDVRERRKRFAANRPHAGGKRFNIAKPSRRWWWPRKLQKSQTKPRVTFWRASAMKSVHR